MASTSSQLVWVASFVLLVLAVTGRPPVSDVSIGAPLQSIPASRSELLSLLDPLESSASSHCASPVDQAAPATPGAWEFAPFAAAGRLLVGDAGFHCKATCDDKPFGQDEKECWGTFRFLCRSNTTCSAAAHGAVGVKCEGHYSIYMDKAAGKALSVCEGLIKYFNARTATCPASGATSTKFMGAVCLGTGVSKMTRTGPPPSAASGTAGSLGAQLSSTLHSIHEGVAAEHGGAFEGKCEGAGGEVKGVRVHLPDAAPVVPEYESVDQLQSAVESGLASLGLPFPQAAASGPPAPAPPSSSLLATLMAASDAKVSIGGGHHMDCELTCNGKEPWLKGALPCWGSLELSCEGARDADADHHAPASTFSFDAACKGFWTGYFGQRCMGLTESHGVFDSSEKDVEAWSICTGKHGMGVRKGPEGYASGQWCKGHSTKNVVVDVHGTPAPALSPAMAA